MLLPFLQVPQDVLPRARTLARILRIPEYQGIGLAVALDAWALEIAPPGDLSGRVNDPCPAEAIALAVGWEGDPAVLLSGLIRVRLVSDADGAVHVLTLAKYTDAFAKPGNRSRQAKHAADVRWGRIFDASSMPSASPQHAGALPTHADGMRNDAKKEKEKEKETTTPLSPPPPLADGGAPVVREAAANVVPMPPARRAPREASALAVASASPPAVERDESGLLPFESGASPPGEDLPSQLQADFQAILRQPYRWDMRRDERAVNELLTAAGTAGTSEVRRRWRIGLENRGFPRVRSLADLVKRWNDCAQPAGGEGASGTPRASDGLAPSRSDVCEGCGRAGQGGSFGGGPEGQVWLGYPCGCAKAWTAEVEKGQPYTGAATWARTWRTRGAQ